MTTATGIEIVLIEDWLKATFMADAGMKAALGDPARVFSDLAPLNTIYPFLTFQMQESHDVVGVATGRIIVRAQYVVKVLAQGADWTDKQKAAVVRMDALIQGARNVAVPDGLVLGAWRTNQYRFIEEHEGGVIRHLGGIYNIDAQAA